MIMVWANFRATRLESGRSPEWMARSKPSSMIVVGAIGGAHLNRQVGICGKKRG